MLNILWQIKMRKVWRKWKCLIWPLLHFYTVLLIRAGSMNSKISALGQSFYIFLLDLLARKFHTNFTSFSISISKRTSGYMGTQLVLCATHVLDMCIFVYIAFCCFVFVFLFVCCMNCVILLQRHFHSDCYECGIGWVKLAKVSVAAGPEWRMVT